MLAASFPPLRFDVAAWIAFVPLFRAIETRVRLWEAGLCGAAFGTAFFFCDLNWIYVTLRTHGHFASVPAAALLVSMVLILALFPAACATLAAFFSRKGFRPALTAPFIWVALEYVRTVGLPDFPLDLVGYSQVERLELIQIVEVTGIYGVSFLVLAVNGALWELFRWAETKQRPP